MEIALKFAHMIGFTEEELAHVRRGALLHDVGKLGIPDSILHKPDKLTEEEWQVMRMHPVYAYQWLSSIKFLLPALDIPYCHHEKWDGTGYPRGLKGQEIPITARLFALVDVWDALCSDRPYRRAMPRTEALEYIRSQVGTHFDPELTKVFIKLVEIDA
jgi:HD-GYP domain-containing protein (c-di-GMP phosphodiesterase class II)